MSRFINCPTRPWYYVPEKGSEVGYAKIPLNGARQLCLLDRLLHGSRKTRNEVFIRSGKDMETFARTIFARCRYRVVNEETREPVIPTTESETCGTLYLVPHVSPTFVAEIEKLKAVAVPRRYYASGEKLPIAKNHKFVYYSDPGHGWLAVPMKLIFALGIQEKISCSSYRNGEIAYLEEDGDADLFINALIERGFSWDSNKNTEYKRIEDSSDSNFIRRQPSYYF